MNHNGNAIESRLWAAADELRANSKLKSSEYSVPVLGLVFLRYADHKFQEAAKELTSARGGGRRKIGPADYQARGVLYLPEAARFSALITLPEGANIGKAINEAMRAIEAENHDLKDVLPKTYNRFENALLNSLLKAINSVPMDIEGDAFGKIYEYFLGNFAMSEGQKGGEFFTPTAIVQLIVEIIEPFQGSIFDPACGSGGMFVQSAQFVAEHQKNPGAELSIYGQEKVAETVRLGKMNLAVHGLSGDIRAGQHLLRRPAPLPGQVRLRHGQSAVQRGPGGQGPDQGRPALPLRNAPHRQRQLPLDPDLLQRPFGNRPRRVRHGQLRLRRPRLGTGDPQAAHRSPRRGRDGRRRLQLLLHRHPALHPLVLRPRQRQDRPGRPGALHRRPPSLPPDRPRPPRLDPGADRVSGQHRPALPGREAENLHDSADLLAEHFPDGQYADVAGLCKVATISEIEAQGWSLNPGRYVGVAARVEDDFDFKERLEELNEELGDPQRRGPGTGRADRRECGEVAGGGVMARNPASKT